MTKIGRYRVESEIGRGAMGVVHLAHDERLGRAVAVKTLSIPDGLSKAQRQEFRTRFLREAQAAAALSHPGIVTVYDADEDKGRDIPFIAMEYVPGSTLRELIQEEGRLPIDTVRELVGVVADALDAAHGAGIVHRDIKPANLLVRDDDGSVKIADFGVARLSSSELTSSGTSLGSPAYMSPEQVRGAELDGRSDLFSLAVIIYEALCGERPFRGADTASLLYAIAHETPIPASKLVSDLPRGLDRFFDRALAKRPEERFRTGDELRRALADACEAERGSVEATLVVPAAVSPEKPNSSSDPLDSLDSLDSTTRTPWGSDTPFWSGPSRRYGVAAAVVIVLLGLAALWGGGKSAYLKLDAKSNLEGTLSLLVDGREVYSRDLNPPPKKRGLLNKMKNVVSSEGEKFETMIELSPGVHEVEARIVSDDGGDGPRSSVVVDLDAGETRRLKMSTNSGLSLKLGG
jgi:serine/threonine-protein kinase